jgi:hypothetical protein
MRTATVRINATDHEVPAVPTTVPGIVLADVAGHGLRLRYTVTHERSGCALAGFHHPEAAACWLLEEVAPLGWDWTQSGAVLQQALHDSDVLERLRASREAMGGDGTSAAATTDTVALAR